jgi:hypothetical protein
VVRGDADESPLTTRRPAGEPSRTTWPRGARPGPLHGAEHSPGGIPGYDAAGTTDADPRRLAAVQVLTWAFLRGTRYPGDTAWSAASAAVAREHRQVGRIESR